MTSTSTIVLTSDSRRRSVAHGRRSGAYRGRHESAFDRSDGACEPPALACGSGSPCGPSTSSGDRRTWRSATWSRRCPALLGSGVRFFLAGLDLRGVARRCGAAGCAALRVSRRRARVGCAFVGIALLLGGNGLVVGRRGRGHAVGPRPRWSSRRCRCGSCSSARLTGDRVARVDARCGSLLGFARRGAAAAAGRAARRRDGRRHAHRRRGGVLLGDRLVLVGAAAAAARPDPSRPRGRCSCGGADDGRSSGCSPARRARSTSARSRPSRCSAFAYLVVIGSLVAFFAYMWLLAQRADLAGRDVRVRQPGRGDRARRAVRRRGGHAARRASPRSSSSRRSPGRSARRRRGRRSRHLRASRIGSRHERRAVGPQPRHAPPRRRGRLLPRAEPRRQALRPRHRRQPAGAVPRAAVRRPRHRARASARCRAPARRAAAVAPARRRCATPPTSAPRCSASAAATSPLPTAILVGGVAAAATALGATALQAPDES